MIKGDQRQCDICSELIPRGTVYHVGFTNPEELESWFGDDPDFLPSITQEEDGLVRFDVCSRCAIESEMIGECTEPTVDSVH